MVAVGEWSQPQPLSVYKPPETAPTGEGGTTKTESGTPIQELPKPVPSSSSGTLLIVAAVAALFLFLRE